MRDSRRVPLLLTARPLFAPQSPLTQQHPVMASPPLQEQWQRSPVPTCNSGTGTAFLDSPRTPLWPGPSLSLSQPAQLWDSLQSLHSIPVRLPPHRTILNDNEFRLLAWGGEGWQSGAYQLSRGKRYDSCTPSSASSQGMHQAEAVLNTNVAVDD